ncbi:MAG: hypothetical protein ACKPCN_11530, partial [Dolichospermum sp.]
ALTDVMRYKVTPPPTPSPLFERGLNMYLIRAETPVRVFNPPRWVLWLYSVLALVRGVKVES